MATEEAQRMSRMSRMSRGEGEKAELLDFIRNGWGEEEEDVQFIRKVCASLWKNCEEWEREHATRLLRRKAGRTFHPSYTETEAVELLEATLQFFLPQVALPPSDTKHRRWWKMR